MTEKFKGNPNGKSQQKGFEKCEFWVFLDENIAIERRSTNLEIKALIALMKSKSTIQKLPTFHFLKAFISKVFKYIFIIENQKEFY